MLWIRQGTWKFFLAISIGPSSFGSNYIGCWDTFFPTFSSMAETCGSTSRCGRGQASSWYSWDKCHG